MLSIILRFVVGPLVGLVVSRAVLEVCHSKGWYPENELARMMLEAPSLLQLDVVFWLLLAAGGIGLWGVLLLVFVLSQRRFPKANLDEWQKVDPLYIWQAGCLWKGIEPRLEVRFDNPAYAAFSMLMRAAEYGELELIRREPRERLVYSQATRQALIEYAKKKNEMPEFLREPEGESDQQPIPSQESEEPLPTSVGGHSINIDFSGSKDGGNYTVTIGDYAQSNAAPGPQKTEIEDSGSPVLESKLSAGWRVKDGNAEIFVRNTSRTEPAISVDVTFANFSENITNYDPKDIHFVLPDRSGTKNPTINPKDQKYFRFASVQTVAEKPSIGLIAGEDTLRTVSGKECAAKFRISGQEDPAQLLYVRLNLDERGELSLLPYKRRKKNDLTNLPRAKVSPLEIIFEPIEFGQNTPPFGLLVTASRSQLEGKEYPPGEDGLFAYMLYRIGVRNNSEKTITGVQLELTSMGIIKNAFLPTPLRIRFSDKAKAKLTPGESEFFDVVHVPVQVYGMGPLVDELILCYSNTEFSPRVVRNSCEICLTARGQNVTASESRRFWLKIPDDDGPITFGPMD